MGTCIRRARAMYRTRDRCRQRHDAADLRRQPPLDLSDREVGELLRVVVGSQLDGRWWWPPTVSGRRASSRVRGERARGRGGCADGAPADVGWVRHGRLAGRALPCRRDNPCDARHGAVPRCSDAGARGIWRDSSTSRRSSPSRTTCAASSRDGSARCVTTGGRSSPVARSRTTWTCTPMASTGTCRRTCM